LNGSMFALDSYDEAENLWRTISSDKILHPNTAKIRSGLSSLPWGSFFINKLDKYLNIAENTGVFSQEGLLKIIDSVMNISHGRELKRKFYACAFNINKMQAEYIHINEHPVEDIKKYLLASSAIPVIFPEVKVNGQTYIDGGIKDNTPVKPLLSENLDYIFIVYLDRDVVLTPKEKGFENVKFWHIISTDEIGGLIKGTLDFRPEFANKLLDNGYRDTKRILEDVYKFLVIENKLIQNAEAVAGNIESFNKIAAENSQLRKIFNQEIGLGKNSLEYLLDYKTSEKEIITVESISKNIDDLIDQAEKDLIDEGVNNLIDSYKKGSKELENLVFDGLTQFSAIDGRVNHLKTQGFFGRLWSGITGKTQKIQAEVMGNLSASLYSCYKAIQVLAERDMLALDFMATITNKLNFVMLHINKLYSNDVKLIQLSKLIANQCKIQFDQLESRIAHISNELIDLKKEVGLLNWKESVKSKLRDMNNYEKCIFLPYYFYKEGFSDNNNLSLQIFDNIIYEVGIDKIVTSDNTMHESLCKDISSKRKIENLIGVDMFPLENTERLNYPILRIIEGCVNNKTDLILIDQMSNRTAQDYRGVDIVYELLYSYKNVDKKYLSATQDVLELKNEYGEFLNKLDEINKKYDIQQEKAEQLKSNIDNFSVRVPMIGVFSSGKTTLINRALGENLFNFSTDPQTSIPAEIAYAKIESIVKINIDDTKTVLTKSDLKNIMFNIQKEKQLLISLNNGFLKSIPNVTIADLPGFESGIDTHDKAITSYIDKSIAYIRKT